MFYHHVKMAYRHFLKHKFFSIINLLGLAFGLSITFIIYLYVSVELNYDTFHNDYESIYRFYSTYNINNEHTEQATTPRPLAREIEALEEVEVATKIQKPSTIGTDPAININGQSYIEKNALLADSNFFDVFSFEILSGGLSNPLSNPNSIMLSETTSNKYFGGSDPVGSLLSVDNQEYLITGVFKDVPVNSHIQFDLLLSINSLKNNDIQDWINAPSYTYGKIKTRNIEKFRKKLKSFSKEKVAADLQNRLNLDLDKFYKNGGLFHFDLEPLKDIYLYSSLESNLSGAGSITNIGLLVILALVILLVTVLNFINLNTSMSLERIKEVGLKKVFGIETVDLQVQIILESVFMCLVATILAIILVVTLLPFYNEFIGDSIYPIPSLRDCMLLLLFTIALGILSGIYPAWYFGKLRLIDSLKGKILKQNVSIKNTFVIVQFSIAIGLIAFLIILKNQVDFLKDKNLGINKEEVVYVKNIDKLDSAKIETLKNEINNIPSVQNTGLASSIPFTKHQSLLFSLEGSSQQYTSHYSWVDRSFVDLMDIKIKKGKNISANPHQFEILVNESLAKNLNVENPIGHKMRGGLIVGIVEDFNFQSLDNQVRPMIYLSNIRNQEEYMVIKLNSIDVSTMEYMENIWSQLVTHIPFQFEFLNETFNQTFKSEALFFRLFTLLSSLALFISFLGLLGLASYTTAKSIKEISIRRVLGAKQVDLYMFYLKKFFIFNLKSFLISIPIIFYASNRWLNSYAYKIDLSPFSYIVGFVTAVGITSLVVFFVLHKTLAINPAVNLRKD